MFKFALSDPYFCKFWEFEDLSFIIFIQIIFVLFGGFWQNDLQLVSNIINNWQYFIMSQYILLFQQYKQYKNPVNFSMSQLYKIISNFQMTLTGLFSKQNLIILLFFITFVFSQGGTNNSSNGKTANIVEIVVDRKTLDFSSANLFNSNSNRGGRERNVRSATEESNNSTANGIEGINIGQLVSTITNLLKNQLPGDNLKSKIAGAVIELANKNATNAPQKKQTKNDIMVSSIPPTSPPPQAGNAPTSSSDDSEAEDESDQYGQQQQKIADGKGPVNWDQFVSDDQVDEGEDFDYLLDNPDTGENQQQGQQDQNNENGDFQNYSLDQIQQKYDENQNTGQSDNSEKQEEQAEKLIENENDNQKQEDNQK